jgi:hypothetical protein
MFLLRSDATATCCRGFISKWHGIEKGRALNTDTDAFQIPFGRTGAPMTQKGLNHAKLIPEFIQQGS